ncbi:interleukin-13 receptor subunit alpha-1-like [Anabas testudineus]|uniref:Fibronectin type-III domain-containing protein n=1 Tax=Anabas testudineus TaxID=64144 RepID=A0A3Q1JCW0_ANATE|nr:interleukin-13 receptor subunit alpha-1-like [Anabas testudineus]
MTSTWELLTFLIFTATTAVLHCNADSLPPPTNLTYKWLDPFTVNVSWSWKMPSNLPKNCVKFEYELEGKVPGEVVRRTDHQYFTNTYLTEEKDSDHWNYTIRTSVSFLDPTSASCHGWDDSTVVTATVHSPKPRAKVVKDFRCFLDPSGMNCSWIPVNHSQNLTLSYRKCGHSSEELLKDLKDCDQYYTDGARDGCYLGVGHEIDICISAATVAESMTFKPLLEVHPPKLTITQREKYLHLSWLPPEVGSHCVWEIRLCSRQCFETKEECQSLIKEGEVFEKEIGYDEDRCYEFRSRFMTNEFCPRISSDFGDVVTFGKNKPHDETLTVVAIVIPIILSICVILSCYYFRKHKDIICPNIPDPSAIFKEMMMNGNRELKPSTGNLYTPVPESTESCKITLVTENSVPQQNL